MEVEQAHRSNPQRRKELEVDKQRLVLAKRQQRQQEEEAAKQVDLAVGRAKVVSWGRQ